MAVLQKDGDFENETSEFSCWPAKGQTLRHVLLGMWTRLRCRGRAMSSEDEHHDEKNYDDKNHPQREITPWSN